VQNGKPSDRLIHFVEYVRHARGQNGRDLTILDVRLECRAERLSEYSDWPVWELEAIEQEAVSYGAEASLTEVISGAVQPNVVQSDSWLHSPSAYAWT
jgi:hypothetical protein